MAIPNAGASVRGHGGQGGGKDDAVPPLGEQLEALELALKGLHACGRAVVMAPRSTFDLRPAARAAERAVAALLDGYDGRRETVTALVDAVAATEELEQELDRATKLDPGLAPAVDWAKASAGWLRKALGAPSSGRVPLPSVFVASLTAPSLHAPVRPTLVPSFFVAEPLPPPPAAPEPIDPALPPAERIAEMRARAAERRRRADERREARARPAPTKPRAEKAEEPRPGFVAGDHAPLSTEAAVRSRARACFEDVAALGMMRVPLLGDDWRNMTSLEQRMFAALDALIGLGPHALQGLESFVVDAPAKDPTRGFAAAMIGGSLAGRDGLAVAQRVLAHLGTGEEETTKAFADGLALAPNPDIPVMLRVWLDDEDPGLRALAVDVLARTRVATPLELEKALADDEPRVLSSALVPAAIAQLPELVARAEALLSHSQEDVARELAWALVLGDVPFAVSRLRGWLGTSREDAALLPVALAGERDDVEHLVDLAAKKPSRARIAALGFGGSVKAIPLLVDVLRNGKDDELKLGAAFALHRLTDAPLFDDMDVAPEKIDVPDPDEPEDPSPRPIPLVKRVGDPRDLPSDGSADRATLPSVDPNRWAAWLAEREPYPEQLRLRRGKAYTPALSLVELSDAPLVPFERRVLHRELIVKTGDALPFDPGAFVATQRLQLDAWAESARRGSSQPGAWGRSRRRRTA